MNNVPLLRPAGAAIVLAALTVVTGCPVRTGPSAAAGPAPVRLTAEYRIDPLGLDTPRPRLGWVQESADRGAFQSAYRILVSENPEALAAGRGDLWDSGRVESGASVGVVYSGRPLRSRQKCFWQVRLWDEKKRPSAWSRPAAWETAWLDPREWTGVWIEDGRPGPARDEDFYADDPAPLFRREFEVPGAVRRARLYVTGLGYYEASINGRRVGDQVLDPGWTDYRKRVFYSTYDVTDLLRKGTNAVGVTAGAGWYNPLPLRMWGGRNLREALPVGRPRVVAQLEIETEAGGRITVATDPSWTTRPGPVLRNSVYLGEVYDARRESPGWDEPGADPTGWTAAVPSREGLGPLQAQPQPPIRVTARFPAAGLSEPRPGTHIFDLGTNFAGWARLRLREPAGTSVRLRFGELLNPDGTLNPRTSVCGQIKGLKKDGTPVGGPGAPAVAEQADLYIAKGGAEETYTPRFTFHGFRYVEVTGLSRRPVLEDLEGLRLNSDIGETGAFSCSSDRLNRIQEMVRRTFLSNIFSVQSDCPHREKFGYGGDLVVTSDAFLLNFDMAGFYAKAAADWADAARPDGMLTDTAPFVGIQYCGLPWAMAHPLLQAQLLRYHGDRRLVEGQAAVSRRWLDLVLAQNPDLVVREGLSDHESLAETKTPLLATPLLSQTAGMMATLAGSLGRTAEAARSRELAEAVRRAYREKLLGSGPGRYEALTQAALAAALELGMVPANERAAAEEALVKSVQVPGGPRLTTGIFGTRFLLNALSRAGRTDLALALVDRPDFPGWGHMLEKGATTLWEHWEFSGDTYSHNHPMFGSVSEWFFAWLAGIQPETDAVGFDRVAVRPQPAAGLTWVRGRVRTVRGELRSEWRREGGRFRLELAIPANTRARVFVPASDPAAVRESGKPAAGAAGVRFLRMEGPAAVFETGSGRYSFEAPDPVRKEIRP